MKLHTSHNYITLLKAAILGCLLCLGLISFSQTRFNVRETFGLANGVFTGVSENEFGYSVIGIGRDSLTLSSSKMNFGQFDFNGNVLFRKSYAEANESYFTSALDFVENSNGNRIACGYTWDNEGNPIGFSAIFNQNGDTVRVNTFYSPYASFDPPEYFISPQTVESSTNTDHSFFIATNIATVNGTGNDNYIQRMTPEGEILWEYIYATESNIDWCQALLNDGNGGVSALMWQANERTKILNLDSEGDLISITDTDLLNSISEAVFNEQNEIIAASIAPSEEFGTVGRICKINMEGELVWNLLLGVSGFDQEFTNIVHTLDDHYVVGGIHVEILDTPTEMDGSANQNGWLVKITDDGEVLWDRKYRFIQSPNDTHTLNDLKATCDGGYIFCGESTDHDWESGYAYSEGPHQQGWLVKVDEYGCLVEDCQLSDNINVLEQDGNTEYFKAGPNPATQFLNIYQAHQTSRTATFKLYNLQGKLLESFQSMSKGTTLMLDVTMYSSGTYVLTLEDQGRVLQQEKIIKQ